MHVNSRVRSVLSSVVALGMLLPLTAVFTPASHAQAAAPLTTPTPPVRLVLNEINWAGSTGNPADQWIELYNPSSDLVSFATTPYILATNNGPLLTLSTGSIASGGFFVIAAQSSATSSLGMTSNLVTPALHLQAADGKYLLEDASGTIVDQAGNGTTADLAGSGGTIIASMARTSAAGDGSLATSWYSTRTIGRNFKAGVAQYGTPGTANIEVAAPTQVIVTPTPTAAQPTVSGKVIASAGQTMPTFVVVRVQEAGSSTFTDYPIVVSVIDGSFSELLPSLAPGLYHLSISSEDMPAFGNRTDFQAITIPGSPQNIYGVNQPTVTLTPPVLNPYNQYVNTSSITLTGTVQPGTALVVSLNGVHYTTSSLPAGTTTFSLPVNLDLNQVNTIEVRAEDSNGNSSAPAIATVTEDSMAPAAINSHLTTIQNGMLTGSAGSVEPNALVSVFSDVNLIHELGSQLAAADGSFGPISLGSAPTTPIYVIVQDRVGNTSVTTPIALPQYVGGPNIVIPVTVSNASNNRVILTWQPVVGAVDYHLRYKIDGGSFSAPIDLCSTGNCTFSFPFNVLPNTQYTFAISALDSSGNESAITQKVVTSAASTPVVTNVVTTTQSTTPTTPVAEAPTPSSRLSTGNSSPSTSTTVEPAPTPTPTVQPSASPSPSPAETGQVKSASDTNTSRNWTPWIILAILIALAVLATAGYFYWFGGEAGAATEAAAVANRHRAEEAAMERKDKDKNAPPNQSEIASKDKKPTDKEKRW